MTITRVKIHKYLDMTINQSSTGKVIFSMFDLIVKMLDYIPEDMRGESATPAAHQIFYIV